MNLDYVFRIILYLWRGACKKLGDKISELSYVTFYSDSGFTDLCWQKCKLGIKFEVGIASIFFAFSSYLLWKIPIATDNYLEGKHKYSYGIFFWKVLIFRFKKKLFYFDI